jgi:hypothetical protein
MQRSLSPAQATTLWIVVYSTRAPVHRLQEGLHPLIASRSRRQFLLGEYEQAVFVAMKAIEVRVRDLGGFADDLVGVDLMNQAFGPTVP